MSGIKDITNLLNLFTEKNEKQNFESISINFSVILDEKNLFQIGNSIVLLLRSREILHSQQQYLIAYFLLWEIGKNNNGSNPFLQLIYTALTSTDMKYGANDCPPLDPVGKSFLASVITQSQISKELMKKSPFQVYQENICQEFDLQSIHKMVFEMNNYLPETFKCGVSSIISFENTTLINKTLKLFYNWHL